MARFLPLGKPVESGVAGKGDSMQFANVVNLRQLFQLRPMAVPLLEDAVGGRCWAHIEDPLDLFCARFGLLPSDLLDRAASLPGLPEDMDWEGKPLYYLLDRLTADHGGFRDIHLPALGAILEINGVPVYPDRYVAGLMLQDFQAFARAFLGHMAEEEDHLFPDALRDEAILRHPTLGLKSASRPLRRNLPGTPDEVFARMSADIQEKIRFQPVTPASAPRFLEIAKSFRSFHEKLTRHAALETGVLGPRLASIEAAIASSPISLGHPGKR